MLSMIGKLNGRYDPLRSANFVRLLRLKEYAPGSRVMPSLAQCTPPAPLLGEEDVAFEARRPPWRYDQSRVHEACA